LPLIVAVVVVVEPGLVGVKIVLVGVVPGEGKAESHGLLQFEGVGENDSELMRQASGPPNVGVLAFVAAIEAGVFYDFGVCVEAGGEKEGKA